MDLYQSNNVNHSVLILQDHLSLLRHDIKTPLSILKTNLNRIINSASTISNLELIDIINISINGVNDIANIIENKHSTKFSVNEKLHEIFDVYKYMLDKNSICTTMNLSNDYYFHHHNCEFQRIIYNLISNSIDSLVQVNNRKRRIIIDTHFTKKYFTIKFHDNGIGIKSSKVYKIFEYGYSTKQAHSGLGLYIIKNYMKEIFSGVISCQSKIDFGTTFTLKFHKD
jgi:signal transduction histidine kinase